MSSNAGYRIEQVLGPIDAGKLATIEAIMTAVHGELWKLSDRKFAAAAFGAFHALEGTEQS